MVTRASMQMAFNAGLLGEDATFAAELWDALLPLIELYVDQAVRESEFRMQRDVGAGEPRDNFMFRELLERATANMAAGREPWDGLDWVDQQTVRALRTFVVGRKEPKPSKAERRAKRAQTGQPSSKVQPLDEVISRRRRSL